MFFKQRTFYKNLKIQNIDTFLCSQVFEPVICDVHGLALISYVGSAGVTFHSAARAPAGVVVKFFFMSWLCS